MNYEWDGQRFDTRQEVAEAIEVALVDHYCNIDSTPRFADLAFTISVKVTLHPIQ